MAEGLREISYVDAGVEALREEMQRDASIVYIGQGIGPRGGNFRQTRSLWKEFGDERLRDTGINELGATGVAIGAAMAGSRAIVNEVFLDFALEAMTQIVQQAANISYSSNGKIKAPVLVRAAMGSVRSAGAHHSHCFYSWFASTPGLRVVTPSTPYDVKGLLKSSLRANGPVIFIEHKALYNTKGTRAVRGVSCALGRSKSVPVGKGRDAGGGFQDGGSHAEGRVAARAGGHFRRSHRPAHHCSARPQNPGGLGAQDRTAGRH